MAIRYELLGYWICVVIEIFICGGYNKQQTDWLQPGRVLYATAVCDAHNDNNHSAAVCVKDT